MSFNIEELTRKVCAIKAKNNMERVEGLHDEIYAELKKESVKAPVLSKSTREKR